MSDIKVSVITICKNEGANVKMTVESIINTTPSNTEVIVVSDGSTDGSCEFLKKDKKYSRVKFFSTTGLGIAQSRNIGASHATGEIIVFCDCHVVFPNNWLDSMVSTISLPNAGIAIPVIGILKEPDFCGFCGMKVNKKLEAKWIPFNGINKNDNSQGAFQIPLTPSACMIMKMDIFKQVGRFNDMFKPYGHEDLELSLRTTLMGYDMLVNPEVKVLHQFRGWETGRPYRIILEEHRYNVLLMAYLHLRKDRIKNVYDGIVQDLGPYKAALIKKELFSTDVFAKRTLLAKTRKYSDNWFFDKFPGY